MTRRAALATLTSAATVAALALAAGAADAARRPPVVRLQGFESCADLGTYASRHEEQVVYPRFGMGGDVAQPRPVDAAPPSGDKGSGGQPQPTSAQGEAAPQAPPADNAYSTTNTQEADVDEPDIVKTNGRHIYAVAQGTLQAVDVTGEAPRLVGSLKLDGSNQTMLLHGNRLLVMGNVTPLYPPYRGEFGGPEPAIAPYPVSQGILLSEVDVSDPAAMKVVRTMKLDGDVVSARMTGGVARVVVSSQPRPVADEPEADAARRGYLTGARWLPPYVLKNKRSGRTFRRRLVKCRQVRHTSAFSGLGMLNVLTIDIDKGLAPIDTDGLMTYAEIVYASTQGLYIATQRWNAVRADEPDEIPGRTTTSLHKFNISNPAKTEYRGSGEVPGYLLNQFSLSEYKGVLRVASTDQPPWIPGVGAEETQSLVTVLDDTAAGKLVRVGQVGGIGRGERIYAVRFLGDVGYVVTFRQIDPLFAIDLSDPTKPSIAGELKIQGYSAYLHPAGDGLLIGVGQDATEQGRTTGTQVSLFDVSDIRNPTRLASRTLEGGSSEAEFDHHAFLWWPATKLAMIPAQIYKYDGNGYQRPFVGAVGFRVQREGVDEVGRVTHDIDERFIFPIRRTVVVGDRVFTLSDRGLKSSRLDSLADRDWVPFSPPSQAR